MIMIIIKRFYGVPGLCLKKLESGERPGGGGYSREFWKGVCREGS